jgi:hypothetical protein
MRDAELPLDHVQRAKQPDLGRENKVTRQGLRHA